MTASEMAECGTVPQTVVNLQDDTNRTAEPMTFKVSCNKVSKDTENEEDMLELEGVIAASRAARSSRAFGGIVFRDAVPICVEGQKDGI